MKLIKFMRAGILYYKPNDRSAMPSTCPYGDAFPCGIHCSLFNLTDKAVTLCNGTRIQLEEDPEDEHEDRRPNIISGVPEESA